MTAGPLAGRRSRVPVILQASRAECGVACLTMVLHSHGHHVPLREVRDVCPAGRDGLSAGGIVRAARQLGMQAAGHPPAPGVLSRLPVPLIAHWEGDHFVVVERFSPRRVRVIDPRLGRRRMPAAEFRAGLGMAVLSVRPGEGFAPRRRDEKPFWRRYLRSLLGNRGTTGTLAQVLLVTLVGQLLVLAMPVTAKIVVDDTASLRSSSAETLLGAGLAVAAAAQLVTGLLRSALLVRLQGRQDITALLGFAAHLLRLPLRYFEERSTGDIVTRFGSIAVLRDLMTSQALGSLLDAVFVLSYLAVLLAVDAVVGLAVLAVTLTVIALLWLTTRPVRERMALDLAAQSESLGYLVEMIEGMPTLKSSAAEDRAMGRLSRLLSRWITCTLRRSYLTAVTDAATSALRFLTPLLVLWLCASRVLDGTLTPGTMLAITWLASAIITPLSSFAASGQRFQLAGAQMQRIADVLDARPEPRRPTPAPERPLQGHVEFQDVSYRYEPRGSLVLSGISAVILAGQRVAVVGSTGSGKTTLGMLLTCLYAPVGGQVRFDGRLAGTFDPRVLRRQIGVVLQEPFIFSGTIRDNISLHDPALPDAEIIRAARLAGLDEEITATPLGYDTRLAQRGTGLSGGQRQRLALARALARRPAVLVLDEATSHLDAATESLIHDNLARQRCTQVIIAHRLSTIRDADQILVLHQGRLAEAGTHHQLLALGGRYATLVTAQLSPPSPDGENHDSGRR